MIIDWRKYNLAEAKKLAEKFGAGAVSEMAHNISRLSLVDKGNLLRSLKAAVRTRDGFVDRVEFVYEWYGRMHEHGADNIFGKGENIEATHWRSDAITKHKNELDKDFGDFYANLILEEITIDSAKMKM